MKRNRQKQRKNNWKCRWRDHAAAPSFSGGWGQVWALMSPAPEWDVQLLGQCRGREKNAQWGRWQERPEPLAHCGGVDPRCCGGKLQRLRSLAVRMHGMSPSRVWGTRQELHILKSCWAPWVIRISGTEAAPTHLWPHLDSLGAGATLGIPDEASGVRNESVCGVC